MIPLVWLPVVCYLVSVSLQRSLTAAQAATTLVFGVLIWSLLEYSLHRFLFHVKTQSYWLELSLSLCLCLSNLDITFLKISILMLGRHCCLFTSILFCGWTIGVRFFYITREVKLRTVYSLYFL